MKKTLFLLLLSLLPLLVMAQVSGEQITRPVKKTKKTSVQTNKKTKVEKQSIQRVTEAVGYEVTINCNVPTATLSIDGINNGVANGSRFLKTGSHNIKLTAEGYEPLSNTIYVNANTRSFSFTMTKSVPKDPYATIGDLAIGVLSEGKILCRLDDVTIEGAKGKEVEVTVFFHNKIVGIIDFITKKVTPLYEKSLYESLIVTGNVSNLTTLRNNKGDFEVYAWILINPTKKEGSTSYDGWGESRKRNMTIYKQGYWKSKGGGMVDN